MMHTLRLRQSIPTAFIFLGALALSLNPGSAKAGPGASAELEKTIRSKNVRSKLQFLSAGSCQDYLSKIQGRYGSMECRLSFSVSGLCQPVERNGKSCWKVDVRRVPITIDPEISLAIWKEADEGQGSESCQKFHQLVTTWEATRQMVAVSDCVQIRDRVRGLWDRAKKPERVFCGGPGEGKEQVIAKIVETLKADVLSEQKKVTANPRRHDKKLKDIGADEAPQAMDCQYCTGLVEGPQGPSS